VNQEVRPSKDDRSKRILNGVVGCVAFAKQPTTEGGASNLFLLPCRHPTFFAIRQEFPFGKDFHSARISIRQGFPFGKDFHSAKSSVSSV
jgi:hypothetical protein